MDAMAMAKSVSIPHDPCNNQNLTLGMDEACLDIISDIAYNVSLWAQSVECDKCDLVDVATLPAYGKFSLLRKTQFPWNFLASVASDNGSYDLCNVSNTRLSEDGRYGWNVSVKHCSSVYTIQESPLSPFSPIVAVLTLLAALGLLWHLGVSCYNSEWLARCWPQSVPFAELQNDLGSPSAAPDAEPEPTMLRAQLSPIRRSRCRVVSLDVFRGICITLMIFVNYGGGQYWFFKHSPWNGLTFADLVFPWFLWIMGTSLALSLRDQLRSCVPRRLLLRRALRRAACLVALGVALNSGAGAALDRLRLPGVLQRLGAAYLVVAVMEVALMKPQGSFQYGRLLAVQDMLDSWLQWVIVLVLVACHVLLTLILEVPGCPAGYLGPGGTHDRGRQANCTGGAAGYIDRQVFGVDHLYQHPSCQHVYSTTVPYDPEGLLGTLTAVLMVYLGVQSGRIIMSFNYTSQRIVRWMSWATLTGVIAGVLCNFSKNDGAIPVNKNLFSLSFVLALSSLAFVLQSVLYLAVDEKRWWSGGPFKYPGMNAIVVYVGHELTRHMFPWSWRPYYDTHWEHMLMDSWATALWIFISYVLYRKKIFLSL